MFITEDSLEFIKKLPNNSVDCFITSPPYNLSINYSTYEDNKTNKEYLEWLDEYAIEFRRVLKEDGHIFLNVGYTNNEPWIAMDVANVFRQHLILQNNIVWCKHIKIGLDTFGIYKPIQSKRYTAPVWENIFHFTKKGCSKVNTIAIAGEYGDKKGKYAKSYSYEGQLNIHKFTCSRIVCKKLYGHKDWKSLGEDTMFEQELKQYMEKKPFVYNKQKDEGNIWYIPYTPIAKLAKEMNQTNLTNNEGKGSHPATFPVELPIRCLKFADYREGWTVIDPFGGTGSTAVACKKLNIKDFYSIDIDSEYTAFANKRFNIAETESKEL
jgi:site-specific DNA-methyltransferase (adenine-specific)